jgi:hypothetical protein
VSAGGELYSIQSWTAQTIPLASDGVNPTVLPISGPSGTQGSMTAVWLLPGQSPPMEDGQLTGAAQYAQGLGQILLEPTTTNYPVTGPPTFTVPVPPTVSSGRLTWSPSPATSRGSSTTTRGPISSSAPPYSAWWSVQSSPPWTPR